MFFLFLRARYLFVFLWMAILCTGCSVPKMGVDTALGREAILEQVNIALTKQDCTTAISDIAPLYNSADSGNDVRMLTASAYGCEAKVNFFTLVGDLSSNSAVLANNGLWSLIAKIFPSTPADRVVEASGLGTDALQAMITPGQIVLSADLVNPGTYNVGSTLFTDRMAEANLYLFMVAMAGVGGIENRFGAPNPVTYVKTVPLPWNQANSAGMSTNGCAYASSILNMMDGLGGIAAATTGNLSTAITNMQTIFTTALNNACNLGCKNSNPGGGWVPTGCNPANPCLQCPTALRDRTKCAGVVSDQNSCAAAGIVNFINTDPAGWN